MGKQTHTDSSASREIWLSVNDVATCVGVDKRTIQRHLKAGKYKCCRDDRDGRGNYLVLLRSLPPDAQQTWARTIKPSPDVEAFKTNPFTRTEPLPLASQMKADSHTELSVVPPRRAARPQLPAEEYRTLWEAYDRINGNAKQRAKKAFDAVVAFEELHGRGVQVATAERTVEAEHGIKRVTLWRYRDLVKGHPRQHWLPLLVPRYIGQGRVAEFSEAAYQWILARYLSTSRPKVEVIVKEARQEGKRQGWQIPSAKTVLRRLSAEPAWLHLAGRQGDAALERSYPTVERDYTRLKLHEMWESDGRRADVFCVWPDGTVARPFIVVWREVRTRLVLAVRGYLHPTGELVMACYREALLRANAKPANAKLDNGREYANKAFTGRQKTRYRFQIKPNEPIGALTRMGTTVQWSKPARGRDKPVESFWNYVADHCDKAAEFQGAYCGRNPVEKPEDFDRRKAVPIQNYAAKLSAAIDDFNRRPHRGQGMGGRSPQDLYAELLEAAEVERPDPSHLRLLLLAVCTLKLDAKDASLRFKIDGHGEARYWSEALAELPLSARQKLYHVYYDPEQPATPVAVYDGEVWLCDAPPIDPIAFLGGGEQAAAHNRAKQAYIAPKKKAVKQLRVEAQLPRPLSAPAATIPAMPLQIDMPRPATTPIEPENQLIPMPGEPNAWLNRQTGQIYRKRGQVSSAEPIRRTPEELEEMKRKRDAEKELERQSRRGLNSKAA